VGIWSHALARVAILPEVILVLRSKPNVVPSERYRGVKEAAKETSPDENASAVKWRSFLSQVGSSR
jgi:hypothetical protein